VYKLVVVGGKLRGKEYTLNNGENIVGRDSGCDVCLPIQGISKRHLNITVNGDSCYLQDLGSSNGTFMNGKAISRATGNNGDKVALPDAILQLVYVEEKKVIIKKRKTEEDDEEDETYITGGVAPQALPSKIIWLFRYKIMPVVHGINEEYEWRSLLGILLAIFCVVTITLTIFPVLKDSRNILLVETAKRGSHYADEIARINARYLEQKELDKLDTKFLDTEDGVRSYELFDMEGKIYRPIAKLHEHTNDTFSIESQTWALKTKEDGQTVLRKLLGSGEIGIAKKIMAFNSRKGTLDAVGIIAIRFRPSSLQEEAVKSSRVYLEALVTTALVAIVFYGIVYFLTIRPIDEMRFQIEDVLRGRRKSLESRYLLFEMTGLRNAVNSLLSRIRELQNTEESDFKEEESDAEYITSLSEIMRGSGVACMVLDSQKNLSHMNLMAEDLTGIRENASQGLSLLDISREQGFAATVIELCDNSANNGGSNQTGEYELGGAVHSVHVASLLGRDGFAKAFLVTMVKDS
jgi:PAS domain-containing protein